jgi:hypothetical protein
LNQEEQRGRKRARETEKWVKERPDKKTERQRDKDTRLRGRDRYKETSLKRHGDRKTEKKEKTETKRQRLRDQ